MHAKSVVRLVLPDGSRETLVVKRSYDTLLTVEWRGAIGTLQVSTDGRLLFSSAGAYPAVTGEAPGPVVEDVSLVMKGDL